MYFGEILYQMEGITKKVLIEDLRELEKYGIITRQTSHENIPRVLYSLTPLGCELRPILNSLFLWGRHCVILYKEGAPAADEPM